MTRLAIVGLLVASGCAPTLRIVAGGDLNLGPRSGDVLAPLAAVLTGDLRIVNLEGPLVDGCAPREETLCAATTKASALGGRIDVASVANNHADDQGEGGRASTVRALAAVGVRAVADAAIVTRRGRPITILARHLPPGALPGDELVAAIRQARGLVIVTLHWGQTGLLLPTPEQRAAARALIEAGAVAVLGHGPHTVQPVERWRHGVIAYSLGNLAFECDCSLESDSFVLVFDVDGRGRVGTIGLEPIAAGVRGAASRTSREPQLVRLLQEIHDGLGVGLVLSPTRGDVGAIKPRR